MDHKEKYEQALKTAKMYYEQNKDFGADFLPIIFPELHESEDERIRKELIEALKISKTVGELKFILPEPTREECIAYLEKQKEKSKTADSIPSDCVSDAKCEDKSPKHSDSDGTDIRDTPAYWKGWDDAMKQKEQKHPNGCFTCDEYKKGYESGRLNGFTAGYNKAMKEIDQKEQKPEEWSYPYGVNETADRLFAIAECLEMDGDCLFNDYTGTECGKFLRDLARKQVECKPAEWSEEDIKKIGRLRSVVNQLASYTDSLDVNGDYCAGDYAELDAWLKSLRPKHKVDDFTVEEFNAISRAIEILYGSHFAIVPPLKDILTKMAQYDKGTV